MRKPVEITIGLVAGFAFLWAAVAIAVWDIRKLQQARSSRDWPRVEGTITFSGIDQRQRERTPEVVYAYTVGGQAYTSHQISFDLFDKPGGQGRIETVLARYPIGQRVTVYYDPDQPATAVLEPEVYSPFFMPLVFAAMFFLGGSLTVWRTGRQLIAGRPTGPEGTSARRMALASVAVSVLIYVVLVTVSFDSAARDTFVKAFGERPVGLPVMVFALTLQTLLYLPMPWVFWHSMPLAFQAIRDRRRLSITYLLTVGSEHPHLRRSQFICLGGIVYFLVICGIWIAYAAVGGI